MSELRHAKSFRDLVVYRKARAVSRTIFEMTKSFPKEETYSLTDQIRRSSRSIGAQITEAWAKRRYEKHFAAKLTDADAEQQETQHWTEISVECGYLEKTKAIELIKELDQIGRMLYSMIEKSYLFCSGDDMQVREPSAEYFAECIDFAHSNTDN